MARIFVQATQELIDSDGIQNISVRKIADRAGFHNSTIYLYFENIDKLILLASLKYFTDYKRCLSNCSLTEDSTRGKFLAIWDAFGDAVFKRPQVFYNFFFGKYSQNLSALIHEYYELFPEEKPNYPKSIEDMYYGNSIRERCYISLQPLIGKENIRFDESNIDLVNTIIVACLRQLLEQQCESPSADPNEPKQLLLDMIKYVSGIH